jgi:hypothetical protein
MFFGKLFSNTAKWIRFSALYGVSLFQSVARNLLDFEATLDRVC